MVGSIPTGSTKNYGPQRQWVLCDIRGMKLLVSRRKIDTAKTKAHGSGSNPGWSTKNLSVQTNKKLLYFQYEKYNDC